MIKVLIRGAGDIATGTALVFKAAGFKVLMTEIPKPTVIRRTVAFASAVYEKEVEVAGELGVLVEPQDFTKWLQNDIIGVIVDEDFQIKKSYNPQIIIDATLAKKNLGNRIGDAPIVLGLGPGLLAGEDCDLVIETKRGHFLGEQIRKGYTEPNTGIPGIIGGFGQERVIKAPNKGVVTHLSRIGALVNKGEPVLKVGETVVYSPLTGCLRGLLHEGLEVPVGFKIADVDPRGEVSYCASVSEKAYAIGRSALEAVLRLGLEKKIFEVAMYE